MTGFGGARAGPDQLLALVAAWSLVATSYQHREQVNRNINKGLVCQRARRQPRVGARRGPSPRPGRVIQRLTEPFMMLSLGGVVARVQCRAVRRALKTTSSQ